MISQCVSDSSHAPTASPVPQSQPLPAVSLSSTSTVPLKRLRLPKSSEEWAEADQLLSAVAPLVLQATTAEEKNTCLCKGIYDVLANRFGTRPPPGSQGQQQSRVKQHDRALKKVTQPKNQARQTLRKAKRQGESAAIIKSLAAKFLSLLRTHSWLKKKSSQRMHNNEAKIVREKCHRDFWRYAQQLLDGRATSKITPEFSASCAHSFFSDIYQSSPHHFDVPPWMPAPPPPKSGSVM